MYRSFINLYREMLTKCWQACILCRLLFFLQSLGPMSHVDFKKWSCRHVTFKSQEPHVKQPALLALSLS